MVGDREREIEREIRREKWGKTDVWQRGEGRREKVREGEKDRVS